MCCYDEGSIARPSALMDVSAMLVGIIILGVWALWMKGWFDERPVITITDIEMSKIELSSGWQPDEHQVELHREFWKRYYTIADAPVKGVWAAFKTSNPVATIELAWTLWCEGREVADTSYEMIASVVINRSRAGNSRWGTSVTSVLRDPGAFSCWGNDGRSPIRKVSEDYEEFSGAIKVAVEYQMGKEPITEATHYHTREVNPSWNRRMQMVGTDGPHLYYVGR